MSCYPFLLLSVFLLRNKIFPSTDYLSSLGTIVNSCKACNFFQASSSFLTIISDWDKEDKGRREAQWNQGSGGNSKKNYHEWQPETKRLMTLSGEGGSHVLGRVQGTKQKRQETFTSSEVRHDVLSIRNNVSPELADRTGFNACLAEPGLSKYLIHQNTLTSVRTNRWMFEGKKNLIPSCFFTTNLHYKLMSDTLRNQGGHSLQKGFGKKRKKWISSSLSKNL
jgi:hypothetical protein